MGSGLNGSLSEPIRAPLFPCTTLYKDTSNLKTICSVVASQFADSIGDALCVMLLRSCHLIEALPFRTLRYECSQPSFVGKPNRTLPLLLPEVWRQVASQTCSNGDHVPASPGGRLVNPGCPKRGGASCPVAVPGGLARPGAA